VSEKPSLVEFARQVMQQVPEMSAHQKLLLEMIERNPDARLAIPLRGYSGKTREVMRLADEAWRRMHVRIFGP
jgi:hypothetical protein